MVKTDHLIKGQQCKAIPFKSITIAFLAYYFLFLKTGSDVRLHQKKNRENQIKAVAPSVRMGNQAF